jgi:hypothetical protein
MNDEQTHAGAHRFDDDALGPDRMMNMLGIVVLAITAFVIWVVVA